MGFEPIKRKLILFIDKFDVSRSIIIKRGYLGTLQISVTLYDKYENEYIIPDNTTAKVRMLKPDGKEVLNNCDIVNNKAIINVTDQMQEADGDGSLEVILFNNGETVTSSTCSVIIKPNVHKDSNIESSDEWLTVLNSLAEIEEAITEAQEAIGGIGSLISQAESAIQDITETDQTVSENEIVRIANENQRIADDALRIDWISEYEGDPLTQEIYETIPIEEREDPMNFFLLNDDTEEIDYITQLVEDTVAANEASNSLLINKAGINDGTATLTEAYSGSKTQGLVNGINQNLTIVTSELAQKVSQSDFNAKFGSMVGMFTFKGSDTYANISAKTGMATNDCWYDTTNSRYVAYNGTAWVTDIGNINLGEYSVTNNKIAKKSITQDNLAFCSANRQFFDLSRLISNKAYNGAGTTTTPGDSRYQIMPPFSIDANKSYYYYKVQGTLSFIKWNDGTIQQFSATYGDASGKITTTQSGVVYITTFTPSGSPTTIFSDALLPYYIGVPPALNYNVKNNDEYINVDLIKHIGLSNIVKGYGGEVYNGATRNSNVMSIPSGSTGNNTYISVSLDKDKVPYQVGDEILYSITYTVTGDSLDTNYQTPINIFVNENTGRFDNIFPYRIVNGNTVKYYSKITIPSGITGAGLRIALQFLNTVALSTTTTITINEVSILSKATRGYYENQINSLILYYPKMTFLTVDQSGAGNFTTLRACLESITDSSKTKPYTVYIKPGQYIMENEYVNPWSDPYFKGLFVPNYVKLIGVGNKEDVRICATSTQGSAYPSALNIRAYAEMENITVDSDGMRYCIHDDFDDIQDGAYQKFKNCHFIGKNNVFNATFGSGCRSGSRWEFVNCLFENKNNGVAFTNHNNVGWTDSAKITFENCRFVTTGGTYSVRFGTLNTNANGILTYVMFKGCKMNGANKSIYLEEESTATYGAGILFKISGYANVGATYLITNTDGKDYSGNIDLI